MSDVYKKVSFVTAFKIVKIEFEDGYLDKIRLTFENGCFIVVGRKFLIDYNPTVGGYYCVDQNTLEEYFETQKNFEKAYFKSSVFRGSDVA